MAITMPGTSKNRWIDLETPLGSGVLNVEKVSGTETLGRMFEYELIALSDHGNINFDDLLGHHVSVGLEKPGLMERRFIDGRVSQVGLVGMSGQLYQYRMLLRPWTWMMTRTTDCRIFQEKDVKEIIEDVFADQPDADFEFRLTGSFVKREYCVQYRETDFNFVSRLMEEEGLYYFFQHEKGKHTLVICDAAGAHESVGSIPYLPPDRPARDKSEYISTWSVTREIQPGATALRDYNFEKPSVDLLVQRSQERQHAEAGHEVYDYPGEYLDVGEGDRLVRTRLEEIQSAHEVIKGSGVAPSICSGGLFTLKEFGRTDQNREYLVVSTHITAKNNEVETGTSGHAEYTCQFELIPSEVTFRTVRSTSRPVMKGPQTAVIVGAAGEEIFVDKYGRVKVQFHWDRYGTYDDKSSCWIRVSQNWAGKNFGWMSIPRVGQEVIVDFLEGDADRPIITGRVYNAEQMPPYELPGNATQTGIKSRSSPGGGPGNANEIRFEDKKGSEVLTVHAEKDMSSHVENDDSTVVGHDQTLSVKNDQTTTVSRDQKLTVERDHATMVVRDRRVDVQKNEKHTVGLEQTLDVGADQKNHIVGKQATQVDGKYSLLVKGSITTETKPDAGTSDRTDITNGNHVVTITGRQDIDVTDELVYKAKRMTFEAEHIEHNITGANSVIHTAPNGPYKIIANEFDVSSNTDIVMVAAGEIMQVCKKYTLQKTGPADETSWSQANSVKFAFTNDVFVGTKSSLSLAIESTTAVGFSSGFFGGLKIDSAAGPKIELGAMTNYGPPAPPAPGAPAGTMFIHKNLMAIYARVMALASGAQKLTAGGGAAWSAFGWMADRDAKTVEGEKVLLKVARDAMDAGHPNVAYRTLAMVLGKDPGALLSSSLAGNTDSLTNDPETMELLEMLLATERQEKLKSSLDQPVDPSESSDPKYVGMGAVAPLGPKAEPASPAPAPDAQAPDTPKDK